jgi:hypothetical protein
MNATPFDQVMEAIRQVGYHNHRQPVHSDIVSEGVFQDLLRSCDPLKRDHDDGVIKHWLNISAPGGRGRRLDLFVGEPDSQTGGPSIEGLRIGVENKSVMTAHRNRTSRFDDLSETLDAVYRVRQEAVMAATVLVGVAERVLNVPDRVKPREDDFETAVRPRLSSGDQRLWKEFEYAVSPNRPKDAEVTVARFRQLPTRSPGHTHVRGYDFVALVPVYVNNVDPPRVDRGNNLGIDVDSEYGLMLDAICRAYKARWHA